MNKNSKKISTTTMITEALKYQQAGFCIIPLNPTNRKPITKWKEFQTRKPDAKEVAAWWEDNPNALIGLVTGEINNLTVVDCDSEETIRIVEGFFPEGFKNPIATTPRGCGRHYFFSYSNELKTDTAIIPKLDIRSDGGFVVVAPSKRANGSYVWKEGTDIRDFPICPNIPDGLLQFLKDKKKEKSWRGSPQNSESFPALGLQQLIDQRGEPYYLNRDGSVKDLNQSFWAGLQQAEHIQLFEPDERAFYRYDKETGLYSNISEDVIKQEISSRVLEVSRQLKQPTLEQKRTASILNSIVVLLKGICEKKNVFQRENKFVHVANGMIVFKSNGEADFCSFSPDFYSRNQCPIPFNASATCERFLKELLIPAVTTDDAVLLQKYAGMCLLGNNLIQKLLILDGKSGRGKSTLALIIQSMIGQANVTELRTSYLNERFELFRYLKKNMLVGVDVPGQFLSERGAHVIKGLVGGDWFDAEQKGGTGSFPFQGNFCILITSNTRLQVKLDGDLDAWKRRLLLVRFEGSAPAKKIPDFKDELIREEGSGILNWALQGLGMLLKEIKVHGDIQLTSTQEETVNRLLAESDSLRHFLVDNILPDERADLSVAEIIEAYAEYCPLRGWNPKPITIIQRDLEGLMLELFRTSKSHSLQRDGKSANGFRRVTLRKGTNDHGN